MVIIPLRPTESWLEIMLLEEWEMACLHVGVGNLEGSILAPR